MNLLENFIQNFMENAQMAGLDLNNLSVSADEDGTIVIRYTNPQLNKDVTEIKQYIDDLDDDIFQEACAIFKKDYPTLFEVINSELKNPTDVVKLKKAMGGFKLVVEDIVKDRINSYSKRIQELYAKYLSNGN